MNRINPKRSTTRWRIALLFLGFLGSAELISSAPIDPGKPKERTSSLSSPRRPLEQDIGSPSELAWQAWLLVDAQPGSNTNLDSASMLRRITPKSVFIAPQLQACADGYKADDMGRCQKIVNIDHEAHLNFLVQRLNQLYGKGAPQSASSSSEKKQSPPVTGPLQLNIPLLPEVNKDESISQVEVDEAPYGAMPLEIKKEGSVVDYDRKNITKATHDESIEESFLLDSNSTSHKEVNENSSSPAFMVPVVDFIDEANETSPEVVDYMIPLSLQTDQNRSLENEKPERVDSTKEDESSEEDDHTTENTLGQEETTTNNENLLDGDNLTTLPDRYEISEDDESRENATVTRATRMENVTESPIRKEIISDGVIYIGLKTETPRNESDTSPIQSTKKNETSKLDVVYNEEESKTDLEDQEEYSDPTEVLVEDSGESEDEILKHGETGMMIPIENQALVQSGKKKKVHPPNDEYPMETTTIFEDESDSITTTEGGEDLESNVSSEVSINKDFVLETTLLDLNTGKVKNSTKPVSANSTASEQKRNDDLKALFEVEKKLITEPEVVLSPQDNHSSNVYGRKRDGQLLKPDFESIKESPNLSITEPPTTSKPLPHTIRFQQDSLVHRDTETYPIEEQASFQSERILPPYTKNKFPFRSPNLDPKPPDFVNLRPMPLNNRRNQDFVRFPSHERPRQGYVRFPSDEVNSIHSPEFKERFSYSREEIPSSSGSTKNSVPFNQKQSNWWVPPPSRIDQQQLFMQGETSHNQNPLLLKFWARMPLVRDPSLDPRFSISNAESFEKETNSRSSRVSPSRRMNFYKEASPHEVKRVFSQNVRTPVEE